MLFLLWINVVHATIMTDLDKCFAESAMRPILADIAKAVVSGDELARRRAGGLAEVVRASKIRCVGDVMIDHLGPSFPKFSRWEIVPRQTWINAQLYAGVKRAEFDKDRCAESRGRRCGLPDQMIQFERRQTFATLNEFFTALESHYPNKSVRTIVDEQMAASDQRLKELGDY